MSESRRLSVHDIDDAELVIVVRNSTEDPSGLTFDFFNRSGMTARELYDASREAGYAVFATTTKARTLATNGGQ